MCFPKEYRGLGPLPSTSSPGWAGFPRHKHSFFGWGDADVGEGIFPIRVWLNIELGEKHLLDIQPDDMIHLDFQPPQARCGAEGSNGQIAQTGAGVVNPENALQDQPVIFPGPPFLTRVVLLNKRPTNIPCASFRNGSRLRDWITLNSVQSETV